MTSAIETALTELSANLRRMEQRHQATGYKFDRLYGLIDAAREELAVVSQDSERLRLFAIAGAAEDSSGGAFCDGMNNFREREDNEDPVEYMRSVIDAGIAAHRRLHP